MKIKAKLYNTTLSLVGVGLMLMPVTGYAQTTTTTSTTQSQIDSINQLLLQLKALQAQIDAANLQKKQVQTQTVSAINTLIGSLDLGATGDQVTILQVLLAADGTIYPEGKITGYFGQLTARAVKRFQKVHGIDQVGRVGPKTLKELNKLLKDKPVKFEDDDDDSDDDNDSDDNNASSTKKTRDGRRGHRPCVIVPPGHLIASGWLRKHEGEDRPIVLACQTLPHGIEKKLTGTSTPPTPTSTPDTTAPVISELTAGGITTTGAHVTWTTNETATSKVWYGTTTPVNASTSALVVNMTLVTAHDVALTGLMPGTTYRYVVSSADASGNVSTGSELSFTTAALADTTAPTLSGIAAGSIMVTSSHVLWTTNEAATSNVWYGTVNPVVTTGSPQVVDASLVVSHDVTLSGLTASTTYYYAVSSADAAANTASSTQYSFTTTQ